VRSEKTIAIIETKRYADYSCRVTVRE